ncbi:MAG: precorrin-6y C5,15-methyltransferase (decarboxylating) subunit CbiE [Lachnospiraceae bacterium]|nr:precorrin-6y C5,15-methyltransferase (decarboxylating) subunit CbiE [Lachnospiraceae bacterium]
MSVTLLGTGGGDTDTLTLEADKALRKADVITGAKRLLEGLAEKYDAEMIPCITSPDILALIKERQDQDICVAFSGDSGFYSGTAGLKRLLDEEGIEYRILPGISSVQLFSSIIGKPWQDWNLFSAHGAEINAVNAVMEGKPAFFLTDQKLTPATLCTQLCDAGLSDLKIIVGEDLSYGYARITEGTASEIAEKKFSPLSVMLVDEYVKRRLPGLSDDEYVRGNVPMTKQEVRAVILSKMDISDNDVIWDVGAGTGGVSVEMALKAFRGTVYAVECEHEGCMLIEENRKKFGAWNIRIVEGRAPEALEDLPAPDRVFIGGTKGNMAEILDTVIDRNPKAFICITAIALETLNQAMDLLLERGLEISVCQVQVSRGEKTGPYHMMKANNPIYVITGSSK